MGSRCQRGGIINKIDFFLEFLCAGTDANHKKNINFLKILKKRVFCQRKR